MPDEPTEYAPTDSEEERSDQSADDGEQQQQDAFALPTEYGLPPASPMDEDEGSQPGFLGVSPVRRSRSAPRPAKRPAAVELARAESAPQDLQRFSATAPPNATMTQISRVMENTRPVLKGLRAEIAAAERQIARLKAELDGLVPRRDPLDTAVELAQQEVRAEEAVFLPLQKRFREFREEYRKAGAKMDERDKALERAKAALGEFEAEQASLEKRIAVQSAEIGPRSQAILRITAAYHDNKARYDAMAALDEPLHSPTRMANVADAAPLVPDAPSSPPAQRANEAGPSQLPPSPESLRPAPIFEVRALSSRFTFGLGANEQAKRAGPSEERSMSEAANEVIERAAKRLRRSDEVEDDD